DCFDFAYLPRSCRNHGLNATHRRGHSPFLRFKDPVHWGSIEEANGASSGHPEAGANRSSSQVEHGKSNFYAQLWSIVTIGIMSAALIHEAKKFPFTASSMYPAPKRLSGAPIRRTQYLS